MPKVSVVLPTYNRAHCLTRSVQSVVAQDFQDWELILVDDGSTDETPELRERFRRALGCRYRDLVSDHRGVSAARNLGIADAAGEYVAFLDSDDFWFPQKLSAQLISLQRHRDAVLSFTDYESFEGTSIHEIRHFSSRELEENPYPLILEIRHNVIMAPTVMVRREALVMAGGFDEGMTMCEDLDLWLRISRASLGRLAAVRSRLTAVEVRTDRIPYREYVVGRAALYARALAADPSLSHAFIHHLYRELMANYRATAEYRQEPEIERIFASAEAEICAAEEPLPPGALWDLAMRTAAAVGSDEGKPRGATARFIAAVESHMDLGGEAICRLASEMLNALSASPSEDRREVGAQVGRAIAARFREYEPGWRISPRIAQLYNQMCLRQSGETGARIRVLILDFDFFTTVGGGQTQYRLAVKNNPNVDFLYPSSGPDLKLAALGTLPANARPFYYDRQLEISWLGQIFGGLGGGIRSEFTYLVGPVVRIAAAVQGMTFRIADMQAFRPVAHWLKPIMSAFGVTVERIAFGLTGWVSVSLRNGYASQRIESGYIESLEQIENNALAAADIRYTVSAFEARENGRVDLPIAIVEMADAIEHYDLPDPVPPGYGPPDLWFVGRLDGAKGPDIFIELVSRIPRHLYGSCYMAGPDNTWEPEAARWSTELLAAARAKGIGAQYIGELSREEIRDRVYMRRTIVVVPSRNDAFGYVALEAILNGCVILLSDRAGVLGYLREQHPHLVPATMSPEDLDAATGELLRLLTNYPNVGAESRKRLRERPFPTPRQGFMEQIYRQPSEHGRQIDDEIAKSTSKLLMSLPLSRPEFIEWRPVRPAAMRPRISVLVPTCDRATLLAPALARLMRQNYDDFEVLVIDDGSHQSEAVRLLAESFGPMVRHLSTGNGGLPAALNRGIEEARGEYVVCVPEEDTLAPEFLGSVMATLDANPDAAGCCPDWSLTDFAGYRLEACTVPGFGRQLMLRARSGLPRPGLVLRRVAARAAAAHQNGIASMPDDSRWLCAAVHGRMVNVPLMLADWRLYSWNNAVPESSPSPCNQELSEIRAGFAEAGYRLIGGRLLAQPLDLFRRLLRYYESDPAEERHNQALIMAIEQAAVSFYLALAYLPANHLFAYCLGSCLAYLGRYKEADSLLCRQIVIGVGDGSMATASDIANFTLMDRPAVAGSEVNVNGRRVEMDSFGPETLRSIDLIYFVCCDSVYAEKFARAALKSLHMNSGMRVAMHIHVINPNGDCLPSMRELANNTPIPIVVSCEYFDFDNLDNQSMKTYYSLARFLLIPELLSVYKKTLIVADVDQLIVRDIGNLVNSASQHDAALLFLPEQAINIVSMFSAAVLIVNPTDRCQSFVDMIRRYLLAQLRSRGSALPWHLDQAALAVATFRTPGLSWFRIPPAALQSDLYEDAEPSLRPETIFWSVTFSQPQNRHKLNTELFRRYTQENDQLQRMTLDAAD